jgi:subtilase family serine protease
MRLRPLLIVVCAVAVFGITAMAQESASVTRVVEPIDEQQRVTLGGDYVAPEANATNDRGAAPDSMPLERLHLVLKRSASQEAALEHLVAAQNAPGNPNYHKWLTPAKFGQKFGPSDQDIATVESWLSSHGFEVLGVKPGKQVIEFNGNVSELRDAFGARIHRYQVNGGTRYSTASEPRIPAALAPVVAGFVSLNDFHVKKDVRVLGEAGYNPKTGMATPEWTLPGGAGNPTLGGVAFAVSPADFYTQYDLSPLYKAGVNGSGQTIAIINDSNINIDLVNRFRSLFGLPANPPAVIIDGNDPGIDGINNPDGLNYDSVEAYLDVEWSGAVAPDANIDLVIGGDTALEPGLILAAEHAVYSDLAPVMSISFGECEYDLGADNEFLEDLWEQAAAQGITVVASAGDSGSAGCDDPDTQNYAIEGLGISGFTSTPYNIAVGGTDFYYPDYQNLTLTDLSADWNTTGTNTPPSSGSLLMPLTEQPWNASQYGLDAVNYYSYSGNLATTIAGGGGGASSAAVCSAGYSSTTGACLGIPSGYPKPAWQTGAGVPSDGVRDIPDVSLFAADGSNYSFYPFCYSGGDCQPASGSNPVQVSAAGGTSFAAPAFAGIMALVDEKYGPQGQADAVLYPLKAQYPAAFHDILHGTNSVPCPIIVSPVSQPPDCIAVASPIVLNGTTEGQIGTGSTPDYNAAAGYNLATGLGSIDATQLVANWGKISFHESGTTLTSPTAGAAFTHGQAITFSGSVTGSPTPTGNVAIVTSSTETANQGEDRLSLDSSGDFSGSISSLPGGTYNVWANYGGDAKNGESASAPVQIAINPETSSTALSMIDVKGFSLTGPNGFGSTVPYGTQLILNAQAVPASYYRQCIGVSSPPASCSTAKFTPPTGTVAFADNGVGIDTAVINASGDAEYNSPFSVGSHSVTASYSGDSSYSASSAPAIAFTVVKNYPALSIGSSVPTGSPWDWGGGQPTVFFVGLENSANGEMVVPISLPALPPSGVVTVTGFPADMPTSATLYPEIDPSTDYPAGVGTIIVPAGTPAGTYNLTITYPGDAHYLSLSWTESMQITARAGLISATTASMSGSISPTSSILVTGAVTGSGGAAPSGYVQLVAYGYQEGFYILDTVALVTGTGTTSTFQMHLDSQNIPQGSDLLVVQYRGDTLYAPSSTTLRITNPLSDFSMLPQTAIVPVTAGTSATSLIDLSSVNSFSGAVTLGCAAAPGVNCSISPSTVNLASSGNATTTLTVTAGADTANLTYNLLVTGTNAPGDVTHTLGIQAVVSGSSAGSENFALSSNPDALAFPPAATTGNTAAVSVTPLGGFSGTVDLRCAVTGSPSDANSPVTCSITTPVTLSGTAQSAKLTAISTANTTPGAYALTVTGTSGTVTSTTIVPVAVGTFTMSNGGNIVVNPGATTGNTSTITVTPEGSFAGTVQLSCAVKTSITAPNDPPTCVVTSPLVLNGLTAQTATLRINTTAATASKSQPINLLWPPAGGTALALLLFFGVPKRHNRLWMIAILMLAVAFTGTVGCGGIGSGGGGGGTSGTTFGTYTVTVSGTSGSIAQTTTLTLTVQ